MIDKIREQLRGMTIKQKRVVFFCAAGALCIAIALAVVGKKKDNAAQRETAQLGPKQLRLDPELLRRSAYDETRRQMDKMGKEIQDLKAQLAQPQPAIPPMPAPGFSPAAGAVTMPGGLPPLPTAGLPPAGPGTSMPRAQAARAAGHAGHANAAIPPPPPLPALPIKGQGMVPPPPPALAAPDTLPTLPLPAGTSPQVPAPSQSAPRPQQAKQSVETLGGIQIFTNKDPGTAQPRATGGKGTGAQQPPPDAAAHGADPDGKKKALDPKAESAKEDAPKVYLPPSILPAKLLTGLDASTTSGGKGNPEPILLRVQAPAILPNSVRAQLRGCFVVAEGSGRLDKERVDIRLLSLNCIDKGGHAVIGSKIKGFVTDEDGKGGLSAHVVSKMGAATARALIAGAVQGAGEAFKTSASNQSISPLGTTQIVNPNEVSKAALGGAVTKGIEPLLDLYVDLAKQAAPVLEKLPGANVTAIVTEGVELEIHVYDRKVGGGAS